MSESDLSATTSESDEYASSRSASPAASPVISAPLSSRGFVGPSGHPSALSLSTPSRVFLGVDLDNTGGCTRGVDMEMLSRALLRAVSRLFLRFGVEVSRTARSEETSTESRRASLFRSDVVVSSDILDTSSVYGMACGQVSALRQSVVDSLAGIGVEVHAAPSGKNCADLRIQRHMRRARDAGDVVVLVSGDGDFAPTLRTCTRSILLHARGNVSRELLAAACHSFSMEDFMESARREEEEAVVRERKGDGDGEGEGETTSSSASPRSRASAVAVRTAGSAPTLNAAALHVVTALLCGAAGAGKLAAPYAPTLMPPALLRAMERNQTMPQGMRARSWVRENCVDTGLLVEVEFSNMQFYVPSPILVELALRNLHRVRETADENGWRAPPVSLQDCERALSVWSPAFVLRLLGARPDRVESSSSSCTPVLVEDVDIDDACCALRVTSPLSSSERRSALEVLSALSGENLIPLSDVEGVLRAQWLALPDPKPFFHPELNLHLWYRARHCGTETSVGLHSRFCRT